MDKIHGPVLPAAGGRGNWPAVKADALAATHSHTYLEPLQLVQPVYPLAAHLPALARQQDVQALIAEPRPCGGELAQPLPQHAAVAGLRSVVPGGVAQAAQ